MRLDVDLICDRYRAGESSPAIARSLGASKPTILGILRRQGVTLRPSAAGRRRFVAQATAGFAGELDEWHAYWLAFLAAHGSIQRSPRLGHRLTLALRAQDSAHLDALRHGLGTDAPLRRHRHGVALILIDKAICDTLAARGVGVRTRLVDVPMESRRPALRGYWDAYGTVSGRPGQCNVNVVAGSDAVLEQMAGWLEAEGVAVLGIWSLTGQSRMLALSRARGNLDRLYELLYGQPCSVHLRRQRLRIEAVMASERSHST